MIGIDRPKDLRLGGFDLALLSGGPIYGLLARAGIARPGRAGFALRILFFLALSWIPLVVLTIWQGTFLNPALKVPFLYDFAEQCRFLFVLPLLIVAEAVVEPWLGYIMAQFRPLVSEADSEKFSENISLAMRSRDSLPIELVLILLAFIRPHFDTMSLSANITSWRTVTTDAGAVPCPSST